MNAIIIEDEQLSAERLRKMIETHTSIQVLSTFYSVKSALAWLKENETPELLFLDIQLGDGTGFDILNALSAYPKVIFTTAFDQYVLDAFKYNSVDYLLKPIKPEELLTAVEKLKKVHGHDDFSTMVDSLREHLKSGFKKKFLIKIGHKYQSIPVDDIAYFYSESSTSYIRTMNDESMIVDHSLDEIQGMIDPGKFFRINRHMIVSDENIDSIDSYFNNRLMLAIKPPFDQHVIVSREKVKSFKEWLDS
ncbi:LytR/AlgR family response regulator transcription factor [Ekhidna sp.]|uniref:LytR/AlgR family response regulator transcription factor n=1 Tax=Ekhidna sp. TaxID=2608089 RepID=UPI003B50B714